MTHDPLPRGFIDICRKLNIDPSMARQENWDEWAIWQAACEPLKLKLKLLEDELADSRKRSSAKDLRIFRLTQATKSANRRLTSADTSRIRTRAIREGMSPFQLAKAYEAFIYNEDKPCQISPENE